ncbi:YciI family protein [Georgenia sp. H159]|uniref:YciI family protein n=1 Tax=Georgenia sp. H159 TaxID=3076115 RepID=UPI002D7A15D6|nr:YciI family protein [Georgenia sp. H159]
MRYLFLYRAGDVPQDELGANVDALWAWVDALATRPEHVMTMAVDNGLRISGEGATPADDEVFGVSVVDVPDLDAATALTAGWPELPHGGTIDVRPEVTR